MEKIILKHNFIFVCLYSDANSRTKHHKKFILVLLMFVIEKKDVILSFLVLVISVQKRKKIELLLENLF